MQGHKMVFNATYKVMQPGRKRPVIGRYQGRFYNKKMRRYYYKFGIELGHYLTIPFAEVVAKVDAYPFTDEVCELFDCKVMDDMTVLYDAPDDEVGEETYTYYIGHEGDRDIGMGSAVITPKFDTLEKLEKHCKAEIKTYRNRAG